MTNKIDGGNHQLSNFIEQKLQVHLIENQTNNLSLTR